MVNNKHVLIANPMWTDNECSNGLVTQMTHHWLASAHLQAQNLGYNSLRLGDQFTRQQWLDAILSHDPILVYCDGHGGLSTFTGYCMENLLTAGNTQILINRVTHLLSCLTGITLGPSIVSQGGLAYQGYSVSYGCMEVIFDNIQPYDCTDGRYGWALLEPELLMSMAVLNGNSIGTAIDKALARRDAWVEYLSTSDDYYASSIIGLLLNNYNNLQSCGKFCEPQCEHCGCGTPQVPCRPSFSLSPPTPSGVHYVWVYAIGSYGLFPAPGKDMSLRIGAGCIVDNCSFLGKHFRIYDESNNEVASGTITSSVDGMNWGESTAFVCPPAGDHFYKVIIDLDVAHGNQVEGKVSFSAGTIPPEPEKTYVKFATNAGSVELSVHNQIVTVTPTGVVVEDMPVGDNYIVLDLNSVVAPPGMTYIGAVINGRMGLHDPPWETASAFFIEVPLFHIPGVDHISECDQGEVCDCWPFCGMVGTDIDVYFIFGDASLTTTLVLDSLIDTYRGRLVRTHGYRIFNGRHWSDSPIYPYPIDPGDPEPANSIVVPFGSIHWWALDITACGDDPICSKYFPNGLWYPTRSAYMGNNWALIHRETGREIRGPLVIDESFTNNPVNHLDYIWIDSTTTACFNLNSILFSMELAPRFVDTPEYALYRRFPYDQTGSKIVDVAPTLLIPNIFEYGLEDYTFGWQTPCGDYTITAHQCPFNNRYNPYPWVYGEFLYWADLSPGNPQRTANPRNFTAFVHRKHFETCVPYCPLSEDQFPDIPEDSTIGTWDKGPPPFSHCGLDSVYPIFRSFVTNVGIKQKGPYPVYIDLSPKDMHNNPRDPTSRSFTAIYQKHGTKTFTISCDAPEKVVKVSIERWNLIIPEDWETNATLPVWQLTKQEHPSLPLTMEQTDDILLITVHTGEPVIETRTLDITVIPEIGGTTLPYQPGSVTLPLNDSVSLTAKPNVGYTMDHWEVNGNDAGSEATLNIIMDEDKFIILYLRGDVPPTEQIKVVIDVKGSGTITPEPATYYFDVGMNYIWVEAKETVLNWRFKHWEVWFTDAEGNEVDRVIVNVARVNIPLFIVGTMTAMAQFEETPEPGTIGFPWWLALIGLGVFALSRDGEKKKRND